MIPTPEKNNLPYKLKFMGKALKGWKKLEENSPEALEKCRYFLTTTPVERFASGGKVKKLHGQFSRFLQFDVTDKARVQYMVDTENRIVYIRYAGQHP